MIKKRNYSMIDYFDELARGWQPTLAFKGKTRDDWRRWRGKAGKKLMDLLGEFPKKVKLNPEILSVQQKDGLMIERVVFDSEKNMSIPAIVLRSNEMKADKKSKAIICCHGHGPFGKEAVAGSGGKKIKQNIREHNYDYGRQLAMKGFLTLCPDLRGFGERDDGADPYPHRDRCNVNFIRGGILGAYTLTLNIHDIKCCVDYLETRPEVDAKRIGMAGLSQGGTMTTFVAAVEPRIKAADVSGYINSWEGFGINRANFCGSQIVPEIFKYFDVPDIAGMIAPRPLLIEMGKKDDCFYIKDLLAGYKKVEAIYRAAGAKDKIEPDVHNGPHAFAGNKVFNFFQQNL